MIMLSKITGVFGTGDPDHFFNPISITTFETGQGQYHVLTGTFKTEKKVIKRVIRYLADAPEVHVHDGQHVVDGTLLMVGVVLDVNTYLAGRGKWMAFQGGKTTLLTTISFNQ